MSEGTGRQRIVEGEALTTLSLINDLRGLIRGHQQHLLANPNPADPWWFLVDPQTPFDQNSDPRGIENPDVLWPGNREH